MVGGPVAAASRTAKYVDVRAGPRPVEALLADIIASENWGTVEESAEKAEDWLPRFKQRLQYLIDEARTQGTFVTFAFSSSGTDYVQGSCFPEPIESDEIRAAKAKRANTSSVIDAIRALSAVEFETLSGKILGLLQVEEPFVSRRSADQGIDFFGRIALGNLVKPSVLDPGGEKHFHVWLAGQAKHYPQTTVSTGEVRELIGSVELAKNNVFAGKADPLDRFDLRVCDPVFYLFFTTGTFTRDSRQVLERAGVIGLNGLQIAQFLADHGVGLAGDQFHLPTFTEWMATD